MYFVHEVIKNEVSCKWFYEIVEGVEDFCVINLPKKLDCVKKTNLPKS